MTSVRNSTGRSSPPNNAATAGSRLEVAARPVAGSGSATPGPTIHRPAAKWNGSTKPRRNGWPRNQPPATLAGLQRQLDRFAATTTPSGPTARWTGAPRPRPTPPDPKPIPTGPIIPAHYRVRNDTIDSGGTVTLRHNSRLHHIGLGAAYRGTRVTLLIDDLHIRIIDRDTGQLIRELTLDPTRDYQPRGLPPAHHPTAPTPAAPDPGPTAAPAAGVKAGRRPPAGHRP